MSVEQMRYAIKNAKRYNQSTAWAIKVSKMTDKQVIAIYYRMARAGEI